MCDYEYKNEKAGLTTTFKKIFLSYGFVLTIIFIYIVAHFLFMVKNEPNETSNNKDSEINKLTEKEQVFPEKTNENIHPPVQDIEEVEETSNSAQEINFEPFMRKLQQRIKHNWTPPKGNKSKRIVVLFKVSKSGELLDSMVTSSSGIKEADKAALDALERSAPFDSLPENYTGNDIDIQFTFDYNVFRGNKKQY